MSEDLPLEIQVLVLKLFSLGSTRPQAIRSLHGCWTCRLRRKKCDEAHPSCMICVGLKLECFGYGPRPFWMDGGMAEKEQAVRVKRAIKRNKRLSREHSQVHYTPTNMPQGLLTPASNSNNSHLFPPLPTPFDDTELGYFLDQNDPHTSQLDLFCLDEPVAHPASSLPSVPEENILPLEISSLIFTNENSVHTVRGREENPQHEKSLLHNLDDEDFSWQGSMFSEASGEDTTDTDHSQLEVELQKETTINPEPSSHQEIILEPFMAGTIQCVPTKALTTSASEPTSFGDSVLNLGARSGEATLFMHYLDHVFYVQFPFYNLSSTHGSRGWILSLLMRDKSVYHAALALSQNHRYSTASSENTTIAAERYGEDYHILALRELQAVIGEAHLWRGTTGLIRRLQVLTCSLHLIHYELLNGATGPWQMHLRAAANIIPQLAKALTSPPSDAPVDWRAKNDFEDARILSSEDRVAMSLILSSFIWLDIMSCASIGSRPLLLVNHISILESNEIHAEELSGCENWALMCIFEISELRLWKNEAQRNGILSVAELARRASRIERSLVERLSEQGGQNSKGDPSQGLSRDYTDSTCAVITKIFALSALTYVHITVSGSNYQLPEIIDSVSKTIEEFATLSSTALLRHLVWPYCVTACMASEEQQSFFHDLTISAEKMEAAPKTWKEASRIVEECWKARKTPGNYDWMSAMDRLGRCILLV